MEHCAASPDRVNIPEVGGSPRLARPPVVWIRADYNSCQQKTHLSFPHLLFLCCLLLWPTDTASSFIAANPFWGYTQTSATCLCIIQTEYSLLSLMTCSFICQLLYCDELILREMPDWTCPPLVYINQWRSCNTAERSKTATYWTLWRWDCLVDYCSLFPPWFRISNQGKAVGFEGRRK